MNSGAEPLSFRKIFALYYPLALSWVFMALESPICVRIISLAGTGQTKDLWTAAFNALMGLSLFIESPVIDLLSTSTALCRSPQRYQVLRKYTLWVMALASAVHTLASLPGIYPSATSYLKPDVSQAMHLPFVIMIPWSASIGWRRFNQGILIRRGQTRMVGWGTFVRVATVGSLGLGLGPHSGLNGIMQAACALIVSVFAESLFVHFAARAAIRRGILETDDQEEDLTNRKLINFHGPLVATTMVMLSSSALITGAIMRTHDYVVAAAGWQVAMGLVWLFRTATFALPEVVIALWGDKARQERLRSFCLSIGLFFSCIMTIAAIFGLDVIFFHQVLRANEGTAAAAHAAFLLQIPLPLIGSAQSYIRGALTALHRTVSRLVAVLGAALTLIIFLGLGLLLHWPGTILGAAAVLASSLLELAILLWALGRKERSETAEASA